MVKNDPKLKIEKLFRHPTKGFIAHNVKVSVDLSRSTKM